MQELATVAEHRLGRVFKGACTLVRDQQALASAALAALTRAAEEARTATEVRFLLYSLTQNLGGHSLCNALWKR